MIKSLVTILFCCLIFNIDVIGQKSFFHNYHDANGIHNIAIVKLNHNIFFGTQSDASPNKKNQIIKVDTTGVIINVVNLIDITIEDIISTSDTCLLILGTNRFFPTSFVIMKLDFNLNIIWQHRINHFFTFIGSNYSRNDLIQLNSNEYLVSIGAADTLTSIPSIITVTEQYFLKIDLSGNILAYKKLKGDNAFPDLSINDIRLGRNNNILATGYTRTINQDSSRIVLLEFDTMLNITREIGIENYPFSIFGAVIFERQDYDFLLLCTKGINNYAAITLDSSWNNITEHFYYSSNTGPEYDFILEINDTILISGYGALIFQINDIGEWTKLSFIAFGSSGSGYPQPKPILESNIIYGTTSFYTNPTAINFFKVDTGLVPPCNYIHNATPNIPRINLAVNLFSTNISYIDVVPDIDTGLVYLLGGAAVFQPGCFSTTFENNGLINDVDAFVSVYPNPSYNVLYVKSLSKEFEIGRIDIFNTLGSMVKSIEFKDEFTEKQLDIYSLIQGLHFIRIFDKKNNLTFVFKFIKL